MEKPDVKEQLDCSDHKINELKGQLDSLDDKIHEISGKFDQADKRISDVQKYPSFILAAVTTVLALFILGIGIYQYLSLEKYKSEVRESINEMLGKSKKKPELVLMADIDRPLEGATINAMVSKTGNKQIRILIHIVFQNKGSALAAPIFLKLYQNPPLNFGSISSDEREFRFEWPLRINEVVPAKASITYLLHIIGPLELPQAKLPKLPMLAKVYYGDDQVVSARFFVNLVQQ